MKDIIGMVQAIRRNCTWRHATSQSIGWGGVENDRSVVLSLLVFACSIGIFTVVLSRADNELNQRVPAELPKLVRAHSFLYTSWRRVR